MHLESLTPALIHYRYWILIPLAVLEGPIVAFVTGTLSSLGYFNPYVAFWIFVVKDMVVDGMYYYLGRFAGEKPFVTRLLRRAHVTGEELQHVRRLWDRRGWQTMFVGKLSFGLAPVFLVVAGIVALPAALFFRYAVGVALVQYAVLLVVGHYVGHATGAASQAIRLLQYVGVGATLIAIIYVRHRLRAYRHNVTSGPRTS
jgi:membrane protein DedA with SNARE-associated domain